MALLGLEGALKHYYYYYYGPTGMPRFGPMPGIAKFAGCWHRAEMSRSLARLILLLPDSTVLILQLWPGTCGYAAQGVSQSEEGQSRGHTC
jgi:hypothetical protein